MKLEHWRWIADLRSRHADPFRIMLLDEAGPLLGYRLLCPQNPEERNRQKQDRRSSGDPRNGEELGVGIHRVDILLRRPADAKRATRPAP